MGIHEELHQIKTGALAPQKDPICFRQAVLYMDEEMGVWEGGGLDYTHIEWFDEWLVEKDRFKGLIPESKGVVVFRPRRFSKRYDKDELKNAIKNAPNLNSTYLLIRNGDNLYRIFTDNIVILPRLFPKRDELSKILEGMSHELEMWEKYQDERSRQEIQDRVDDEMYQYRKRAILLQGLIDRTDVFLPLPAEKVSMFKMDETPDAIRFIYDDEMQLPTGRLPFWEWHKEVNLKIKHGSRVLFTGNYYKDGYRSHSDFRDRIYYFVNEFNAPAPPAQAVYVVEKYKQPHREWKKKEELEELKAEGIEYVIEDENPNKFGEYDDKKKRYIYNIPGYRVSWFVEHLTIMHNPGGKTRHGWSDWEDHDRVKRIRFRIYPEDKWLINYDQISLDDIEFYLTSRVDRPKYLYMMPVLEKIKIERVKELEQEEYFIQFVIGRNAKIESIEKRVREAVNWWKYKNQWKRPIAKDDTLALRMIEKRVQSKNYDSFEHFDKL